MNRTEYYNYIDEKLHTLAHRITTNGKLNMLHLHMHSENFYLHLFNLLYEYNLKNLNESLQNVEAIDLIDDEKKIVIQVSATNTKQKIESSLNKKLIEDHADYTFKFISIAKDVENLKKQTYNNPYSITFNPTDDIHDIASVLNTIMLVDINKQKQIYQFIKEELGNEVDIVKLDSNLAIVINLLAKEKWDDSNISDNPNPFEIDRKISHNELNLTKDIIEEYQVYYGRVDKKYSELDEMGNNKSNSVLATIRREYRKFKDIEDKDEVFLSVIDNVQERILKSSNYIHIPIDELELCIDILVVDAFIRCKIFENPEGYNYATS